MTKVLNTAKFVSADKSEALTIIAAEGKKGFNVKVTMKINPGVKGAPKASTGARSTHADAAAAKVAFDKLVKEAAKAGWTAKATTSKNAFSAIPAPKTSKPRLVKKA